MNVEDTVLVTGFAQVPKGTTLYESNKIIGVVLVINCKTEIIEECELTFVANLTNSYMGKVIKGFDLKKGLPPLLELVRKRCNIPSQGAIIQAVRSAFERYQEGKPY